MKLTIDAVRVLEWILANGHDRTSSVEIPTDVLSCDEQRDVLAELGREGLVVDEPSAGGGATFTLDPARRSEIRAMARKAKQALLERAVLEYVDANDDRSGTSDVVGVLADSFSNDDVERCVDRLHQSGFLDGISTWGSGLARMSVNTAGAEKLDDPYVVIAAGSSTSISNGDFNTWHVQGSGNVLQNGRGNTASTSVQGIDAQALHKVLEAIRRDLDRADGADGEQVSELRSLVDEAAALADAGEDPSKIRTALRRLKTFGGDVLTASTAQLIAQTIGM
ncbi:hypothetical protein [Zhihengliuella halotolerans]|uniref:Uncharacterized protein n=1 Tax=Zhihengliuella halotolerans TaxID=370736 RepID=A0A4Q8AEX3_9MICC|nr:hypothetical protein [Zhihengliuella halotolerans]RZU62850.1 hypothetical protein EV380_2455 [Zhihengliuella halotolerans]